MGRKSKYQALLDFLKTSNKNEVAITFREIEKIINYHLPSSARMKSEWWSNRRKGTSQSLSWMEAGFRVVDVDLEKEIITFQKPIAKLEVRRDGDVLLWNADLIKTLRLYMGLNQSQFAEKLGVRQQTISEWETNVYKPSLAMMKLLTFVAKEANAYDE